MNLCVIGQYYPPDVGGASTRTASLVRCLIDNGHAVTLVTAFPHYPLGNIPHKYRGKLSSVERDGKLRVIRVWVPPLAHAGMIRRLIMYASFSLSSLTALPFCRGSKVTWAMSPNYFCIVPATALKLITRTFVVHDVVDIWPGALSATGYSLPRAMLKMARLFCRICYALSDVIVTLSDSMRDSLAKVIPSGTQVTVLENCVDSSFLKIPMRSPADSFRITYVGSLSPSNNFPIVLQAAMKVQEHRINFAIVGSGEMAGEISSSLRGNRITNVQFENRRVKHNDVPGLLAEADALILPLRSGFGDTSFPSKLAEYWASARPVLCVADGELGKEITTKKLGLVVRPEDPGSLLSAIHELHSDPDLCKRLAKTGREYAKEHLSESSFDRKVMGILQSMVQSKSEYLDEARIKR
jgi:glycosyltransferase involved in cell wall biosynthesis